MTKEDMLMFLGGLGLLCFVGGLYYLFQPMDEPRGIGLMIGALVVQNWKRNIQGMKP